MLDLLGEREAAAGIVNATEATLVDKALCTADRGGIATIATAGKAIANALASLTAVA